MSTNEKKEIKQLREENRKVFEAARQLRQELDVQIKVDSGKISTLDKSSHAKGTAMRAHNG